MGLDRIIVKGYKSIRDLDLPLKALNVLIGANGAGKSNFISLFNFIGKKEFQTFVLRSGGGDSLLYFGRKNTKELSIQLFFGPNSYDFILIPTRENTLVFSHENWYFQPSPHEGIYSDGDITSGHKEFMLYEGAVKWPGGIAAQVFDIIKSWEVYHFHDTSESSKMKQPGNINDNFRLNPDASNLAAYLYLLQQKYPANYKNIIETVQLVAPFFEDFILRQNPLKTDSIQLEWREKGSDAYFNAYSFSDGTLRFICLATLLLQPVLPSTILLDEPELGLHPYAIILLASLLESAATKTQVVVSTQSVTLVNQMKPESIIVVNRDDNQSTFTHLDETDTRDWLNEYGLGDLWEKNIIGRRP